MNPGSVCRHLKIAGRVTISRFFHVATQQPEVATHPVSRPLPGVASILEIHPSFFVRAVGQIAKGGKVELIRRMDLDDPQISRLMESLRADIEAGSPGGSLFGESVALALSAHVAQLYSTLTTKLQHIPLPSGDGLDANTL
jgi:hypothetical protein